MGKDRWTSWPIEIGANTGFLQSTPYSFVERSFSSSTWSSNRSSDHFHTFVQGTPSKGKLERGRKKTTEKVCINAALSFPFGFPQHIIFFCIYVLYGSSSSFLCLSQSKSQRWAFPLPQSIPIQGGSIVKKINFIHLNPNIPLYRSTVYSLLIYILKWNHFHLLEKPVFPQAFPSQTFFNSPDTRGS